jgi:hypothetical protein
LAKGKAADKMFMKLTSVGISPTFNMHLIAAFSYVMHNFFSTFGLGAIQKIRDTQGGQQSVKRTFITLTSSFRTYSFHISNQKILQNSDNKNLTREGA